jgi:branched-chain amino acid transport system substrate-binding protein
MQIGVLVDETGDWKSLGIAAKAALELKQEQIQDFLRKSGSDVELQLNFADTKSDPELALKHVKKFSEMGIRLLIGPATSQEVSIVTDFVNRNDMLVLSYGSIANKLALPGDNVFRFVNSDIAQSKVVNKYLQKNNIKYLWQLYRNDLGNMSLSNMVNLHFKQRGSNTVNRFVYKTQQKKFNEILNQIAMEIKQKKTDRCAIHVAGFNEIVNLFQQAANIDELHKVLWIGGDGTSTLNELIINDKALLFALDTEYTVPIHTQTSSLENKRFIMKLEQEIGFAPNSYALAAADILQIIVYSHAICHHPDNLKKTILEYSAKNFGLTGNTKLDKNGDREDWNYEFWQIKDTIAGHKWKPVYLFKQEQIIKLEDNGSDSN